MRGRESLSGEGSGESVWPKGRASVRLKGRASVRLKGRASGSVGAPVGGLGLPDIHTQARPQLR